jgi:hypothetical protein
MKTYLVITLSLLTYSCTSMGPSYYMQTPDGAIESGSGPTPVLRSDYEVNSELFPTYNSIKEFMPPTPVICSLGGCSNGHNIKILPTDNWRVTHKFKDKYIIQSDEYNIRYCSVTEEKKSFMNGGLGRLFGADCTGIQRDLAIYINPKGNIDGGWEIFSYHDDMYFSPTQKETEQWESGIVFQPKGTP